MTNAQRSAITAGEAGGQKRAAGAWVLSAHPASAQQFLLRGRPKCNT